MDSILVQAVSWLKGLAIISFGLKALKHLWPLILLFIFGPEFNVTRSGLFPFWNENISSVTDVISDGAYYLRKLPLIAPIFEFTATEWNRLIMLF